MLRRFEMYRFAGDAGSDARGRLCTAFLECARYIPEVLHSALGREVSVHQSAGDGSGDAAADRGIDVVWEHAFGSLEAYRRYMEHPYHACVLDRYLLGDSPERVVVDDRLGVGLAGYRCDAADFFLASGIRRLVFVDLGGAVGGTGADWQPGPVGPRPQVSVFAANTMASAWFDGERPVGPAPRWTHLLEQGFAGEHGSSDTAALARVPEGGGTGAPDPAGGVASTLTVAYRIQPGRGYAGP